MNLQTASYRDILAELTRIGLSLEDVAQVLGNGANRQRIRLALISPPKRKMTKNEALRQQTLKVVEELLKPVEVAHTVDIT